jgi:uncharacterized membrane protein
MAALGKTLLLFGAILLVLGGVVLAAGRIPWIGRLPGDLSFRRNGVVFYLPLASCLLVSILLSLLASFFRR